jgi:hypothetical protein
MQFAPQTANKLQQAAGFGFDNGFHHQIPVRIQNGGHRRVLVHVHADILNITTHVSCLLGGKLILANVYLSPRVKLPWFSPALLEAAVNHPESRRGQRQLSFTFLKRGVLS